MSTTRRNFVRLAAASSALGLEARAQAARTAQAAPAGPATQTAQSVPRPATAFDPLDWASVRAQFELDPALAHLANFYLASHPAPVREAIERHRRALDQNPYAYLDDHMFARPQDMFWPDVAAAAAEYLGGRPQEVALTSSTTMGLALIYNGLRLRPDQEVLTTTHDFYPHHEAIRLALGKWGGSLRRVALYDASASASADEMVGRLVKAVRANTRVVGVTWVHSGTGVVLPIRPLAAALAELNRQRDAADRVLLVVDGVHGFGVLDEDAAGQGADFFAAGTHKWMLAPRGTGIVWGKAESWPLVQPTIPSLMAKEPGAAWRAGRQPEGPTEAAWVSPGGFCAYEHQWAMVEAFRFHRQIGRRRVAERIGDLNGQLRQGLAAMRHVKLHTPLRRELSAGFVCFDVQGLAPAEVVGRLRRLGIVASGAPYGVPCARLSAGIVNNPADIERALAAVHGMA